MDKKKFEYTFKTWKSRLSSFVNNNINIKQREKWDERRVCRSLVDGTLFIQGDNSQLWNVISTKVENKTLQLWA